ncbi:MAG: universal stress protein [Ornithinimicrobium sp.]
MTDGKLPVTVGYDGSEEADEAVDWAAVEADRLGTELVVLLATDTSTLERSGDSVGRGHSPRIEEQAKEVAEAGAARARVAVPGLAVSTHTTALGAAAALRETSTKSRLVVVGRRSRARLSDAVMGTVQFAVATHAECPVVVVPTQGDVTTGLTLPVVVGVDGSEGSIAALREAADAASRRDADLIVVCAWKPRASWSSIPLTNDRAGHEEAHRARSAATETMGRARELLDEEFPELTLREIVAEGRPSTLLARESSRAGLVVVGARGQGDLSGMLLGSVGRNLIYRSDCPVAIIR